MTNDGEVLDSAAVRVEERLVWEKRSRSGNQITAVFRKDGSWAKFLLN
jgi:hypothetical protein